MDFFPPLLLRRCWLFRSFAMRSLKQSWMVRELDLIVRSPRLYSRHLRIDVRSLPGVLKRDLIFTRVVVLFLQAPAHVVVAIDQVCVLQHFKGAIFLILFFLNIFFFGYRHLRTRWLRSTKLACCSISRKRRAEVLMCSAFIPSTLLCGVYKCR